MTLTMRTPRQSRRKQVRLTTFNNEPLARLAEQRLQQEGIPCLVRSLQGGPGLWGSAYNLPHSLYVYQSDEMRAREVLDLTPLEIIERDCTEAGGGKTKLWLLGIVITIVLALIIAAPSFIRLLG
jgi:hypothetical protein